METPKFTGKRMDQEIVRLTSVDFLAAVNADVNTAAVQTHMDKFHASQGHGFAAEQANHLYDVLTGQRAVIIGGDNAKNGADRLVNGFKIQTKYCQEAVDSVAAAFCKGQYRYINPDGSLMQLEVPSDQYEKAVGLMARRIERGQVPGITNPLDAREIVRKGHFTYTQAQNIVKFGTVESLTFDAVNGAIVSTSALGISAALVFAQSLWNGDNLDIAIENAAYSGLQIGGASFANSVICAQLMRTGLSKALIAPTDAVVKMLGPKASASISEALRSGANISGAAAMKNVSKLLRGNFVTSVVMTAVLSAKDIRNMFQGRISGAQLFKNLATTAGGVTGGTVGLVIGKFLLNWIAPGSGEVAGFIVSLAGATVGGAAGSSAVNTAVGKFIEDDAVALVKVIEETFCQLAQEYLLTEEEIDIILTDLCHSLEGETLLDMFASPDHHNYADQLVRGQIERLIRGRCRICLPTEAELIHGISRIIEKADQETGIWASNNLQSVDPVAIGKNLTGQELLPHVAKRSWYSTKQMNLAQLQAETRMKKIRSDEERFKTTMGQIRQERNALKSELAEILGGTKE